MAQGLKNQNMAPRMICALLMRIRCVTGGEENLCAQVSEGGKAEGKHSPIHCEGKTSRQ